MAAKNIAQQKQEERLARIEQGVKAIAQSLGIITQDELRSMGESDMPVSLSGMPTNNPAEVFEAEAADLPEVISGEWTLEQGIDFLHRNHNEQVQIAAATASTQARQKANQEAVTALAKNLGVKIDLAEPVAETKPTRRSARKTAAASSGE